MRSDELRNEILRARDARHEALRAALAKGFPTVLLLSLNLPGEDKHPPGSESLSEWARRSVSAAMAPLAELARGEDALGPFALFAGEMEPAAAKVCCVALEESDPAARLLDLDVFDFRGRPVDRALLGLPQRTCLICGRPARECIRAGRHDPLALQRKIHELLARFRP